MNNAFSRASVTRKKLLAFGATSICTLALLVGPVSIANAIPADKDGDGFSNNVDNCPNDFNADQLDTDTDGKGNVCDTDDDNDGVLDVDELLNGSNPLLADTDDDGLSDLVDPAPIDKLGVFREVNGDGAGEKWATSLAYGRFDDDAIDDVLVGTPYDRVYTQPDNKALSRAGTVRVYSGADGQEIIASRISGTVANQRLGAAIAVVPDQDTDGKPDILVGEPLANVVATLDNEKVVTLKGAGRVALYSGATGAFIRIVAEGKKAGDRFGSALAVGNANNTGSDDLIVGAPMADVQVIDVNSKLVTLANAGQITAFNGISNVDIYHRDGTQKNARMGAALAMDIDNHLLVGEPLYDVWTVVSGKNLLLANAGRVQMFAGDNGSSDPLFTLDGTVSNDWLGSSLAALPKDINADAQADWLVGVPRANVTTYRTKPLVKNDAGKVMLLSGQNKTGLVTLTGTLASDRLGAAVTSGDFNNDGTPDLAVGATQFDVFTTAVSTNKIVKLSNAGKATLYSGAALLP